MNIKNGNLLVYKNGRWLMGSGGGNIRDTVAITLKAVNWTDNLQIIPCNSVGSNSVVMPNPTAASKQVYINAGIELIEATAESLTFTCANVPTEDIAVLVHIIDPLISADVPDGVQTDNNKIVLRDSEGNLKAVNPYRADYPNLVYSYTHTSNKEVHPTALDLATGVWTAEGHGLTQDQRVFAVVHNPYHYIDSLGYLPGGLETGTAGSSAYNVYYVNVVDENTFTLSTTQGGDALTYTEKTNMDLAKFHFEVRNYQTYIIKIPESKAACIVIKGRIKGQFQFLCPDDRKDYMSRTGAAHYDSASSYSYGYANVGSIGAWGGFMCVAKMEFIEPQHLLVSIESDASTQTSANYGILNIKHGRNYNHFRVEKDILTKIFLGSFQSTNNQDAQFFNGTTMEVYTR